MDIQSKTQRDIGTRADVHVMVDRFYDKVKNDPLLGPIFSHVNWPVHLPIMVDFWSSMILGDQSYRGNPLQRHLHLTIDARHFEQWIKLFKETIDECFAGDRAEEIKMRAQSIAAIFQMKMGIAKR